MTTHPWRARGASRAGERTVRYVLMVVAVVVILWAVWLRPVSGPPELVVGRFLQSVQRENWGTAQTYLVQHMRARTGQEGIGGMQRFTDARLEPFRTFDITGVTPRGGAVDVVVSLRLPVAEVPGDHAAAEPLAAHGHPGRIEGDQFVHAHRFQLQREGRAWRIYQFEEVEAPR